MKKPAAIFFTLFFAVLLLVACSGQDVYVPASESAQHDNNTAIRLFQSVLRNERQFILGHHERLVYLDDYIHYLKEDAFIIFLDDEFSLFDMNGDGVPEVIVTVR